MTGWDIFYIIPKEGEKLTAYWQDEKGIQHKTELPAVKNTGVSLQVLLPARKEIF